MAAGLSLSEQFLVLFNNVKSAAGGDPKRVPLLYKSDRRFRDAFDSLSDFIPRSDLERRVFHGPTKIVRVRAPSFDAAWKEYEQSWRFEVTWPLSEKLSLSDLLVDLDGDPDTTSVPEDDTRYLRAVVEKSTRIEEASAPDPEERDEIRPN